MKEGVRSLLALIIISLIVGIARWLIFRKKPLRNYVIDDIFYNLYRFIGLIIMILIVTLILN